MRQIEVINQETIIDVTAETSSVEILVRDYDSELVERFALEAQEAAIEAEESADIATAQASIATAQATIATTQAGIATTQAGIATTQSGIATTKANEASASAASALASEQAADADRIAAQAAASTATTQAGIATTQAGIATTKAGEASASAAAALASETDAETAASTATTQAGIATTQAGIATTQAGIATTQAGNALTSANNAAASAASAAQVGTSTPLTGFSTGANSTILATDTILQGFNKTQGQINARVSGTIATGQVAFGTAANTVGGSANLTYISEALVIQSNSAIPLTLSRGIVSGLGSNLILRNTDNTNLGAEIAISFSHRDTGTTQINSARISSVIEGRGSGVVSSSIRFYTSNNDNFPPERWRITSLGVLQSNGAQTIQTSTGNLTLATGGGNGNIVLTPNGTGNVGINTVTPAAKLEILSTTESLRISGKSSANIVNDLYITRSSSGTSVFSGPNIRLDDSTLNNNIAIQNSQGNLGIWNFSTGSWVQRFVFTNSNNFLINTTTDSGFRLDVNGTARVQGNLTTNLTAGSVPFIGASGLVSQDNSTLFWDNTNKRLGIGTNAPARSIDTTGIIRVGGTFIYGDTNNQYLQLSNVNGTFLGYNNSNITLVASSVRLVPNGIEVLRALQTGNVIIQNGGTFTDAGFRLDVNGTARVQGVLTATADAVVNGVNVGRGASSIVSNTRLGTNNLNNNSTGFNNTAVGYESGLLNTTGDNNSFFGSGSGRSNTTGSRNSFIGQDAGRSNTTGFGNSFFGQNAGFNTTSGGGNIAIGRDSLFTNNTGTNNIAIGTNSLINLTGTHSNNLAFGIDSGRRIADASNLTIANNSVFIGFDTRASADNQTNQIVIGTSAIGLGSNTTVIGNSSTSFGRWYGSLLLGTTTNAASSILTMESTTQGFLPPRMTTTQRDAIASPATGLMIYNTTDNLVQAYNGTSWINL